MRILLQQKPTGLYLTGVDSWSESATEAMDFLSSTAALEFCATNQLTEMQLVLRFEEQKHDIVLPVTLPTQPRSQPPPRPTL